MDIKFIDVKAAAEKGLTFKLKQPFTEIETDVEISVYGVGSKKQRSASRVYNKSLQELREKYKDVAQEDLPDEALDEIQAITAKFAAECTQGWKNITDDGVEVEFSEATAIALYMSAPQVCDQVVEQVANMQEMLGKPKASSKSSAK